MYFKYFESLLYCILSVYLSANKSLNSNACLCKHISFDAYWYTVSTLLIIIPVNLQSLYANIVWEQLEASSILAMMLCNRFVIQKIVRLGNRSFESQRS